MTDKPYSLPPLEKFLTLPPGFIYQTLDDLKGQIESPGNYYDFFEDLPEDVRPYFEGGVAVIVKSALDSSAFGRAVDHIMTDPPEFRGMLPAGKLTAATVRMALEELIVSYDDRPTGPFALVKYDEHGNINAITVEDTDDREFLCQILREI